MVTAKQVASYFIEKASQLNENNDLTNLKLQKMLYFAQVEHLKKYGEPLFDDPIEAWKYGPVIPAIYEWLKDCGAYQITRFDIETDTNGVDGEMASFLEEIWERYSIYSASGLVKKTHEPGSAWAKTYNGGKGNRTIIPVTDLVASATI